MDKPQLDFVCPACKAKSKILLEKKEFSTFRVKCPACGKTVQLTSIKGFKQIKLRRRSIEQIQREFRDAKNPPKN